MKSPPVQHRDDDARRMVEAFIDAAPEGELSREPALVAD
jgi:hypothetical protein